MKKATPFFLIRIAISLVFIAALSWTMRDKWSHVSRIIKNIDVSLLILGGVFFTLGPVVLAQRIRCLLRTQNIFLNPKEAVSLTFIGYFFNNFLPTAIGGDFVKAYYASRKTSDKVGCFTTVFMDRVFGISSLFLLAAVVAAFTQAYAKRASLTWPIFAVLGVLAGFFIVSWNRRLARFLLSPIIIIARRSRLGEKLKRAYDTVNSFKDKKGLFLRVFVLSIAAQLISFSAAYFWLRGLGSPISLRVVFLIMPLITVLSILPSINGLGIRESAMVFLFTPHAGMENAFTLSLLWLCMLLVVSVIGGLNYAFGSQYRLAKEAI